MTALRSIARLLCVSVALTALLGISPAQARLGAASLIVLDAESTPTHWDIPIGVPTTALLCGVTTDEAGDPLPAEIPVWIKSSEFGNTELTATLIGIDCYEFTYTPPAIAAGDLFDACATVIVAYIDPGTNANNAYCEGVDVSTNIAACGFRFVDAMGLPIDCDVIAVDEQPWGRIKSLYR